MAKASEETRLRLAARAFAAEIALLLAATSCAIGYSADITQSLTRVFALIALTAVAMGVRNAAVRKLSVPDPKTTVLALTVTGLAADSSLAGGNNPRLARRVVSILGMFAGAGWKDGMSLLVRMEPVLRRRRLRFATVDGGLNRRSFDQLLFAQ